MTAKLTTVTPQRVVPLFAVGSRRSLRIVERNARFFRRSWMLLVSGFFEPVFYLLSLGIGLNHLIGPIVVGGHEVSYAAFVAPALLATSAMNGALMDATMNLYFKLRIAHAYDAVLATPLGPDDVALGELTWCVLRSALYSTLFLVVMVVLGYTSSPLVVLCLPAAVLMGLAFGAAGMATTTYLRSWQDFDLVNLAVMPMFLFSATFYPITVYPGWLQLVVRVTPLYQGVALSRACALGELSWSSLGHVAYLAIVAAVGYTVVARRIRSLLAS